MAEEHDRKGKRPKLFEEQDDRLSCLPEEILGLIFSNLPAKETVRTSCLSKRWINVWKCSPILTISNFSPPAIFMERLLSTDVVIHKFSLGVTDHPPWKIMKWLRTMKRVKHLDLNLNFLPGFSDSSLLRKPNAQFPESLFKCSDLVALTMWDSRTRREDIIVRVPSTSKLPNLTALDLDWVHFSDEDSLHNLIKGCTMLQELALKIRHDSRKLKIISNSLKKLKLNMRFPCSEDLEFTVFIDTPSLEVFNFDYHVKGTYDLNDLSCLRTVCVEGCSRCATRAGVDIFGSFLKFAGVLGKFYHARYMSLNCHQLLSCVQKSVLNTPHMEFPQIIFRSKVLVTLKLADTLKAQNIAVNVPSAAQLPSLKFLQIHSIKFVDNQSLNNLIEGCPILEDLDLVLGIDITNLSITSNSLKRLYTRHCCKVPFNFVLDTKTLETWHFDYHNTVLYTVSVLPCLEDVKFLKECIDCREGTAQLLELVTKFYLTKHLVISGGILRHFDSSLPVFSRLTHLTLESFKESWKFLPSLFERLPSLVSFVLIRRTYYIPAQTRQFQAPHFELLHLEEVQISGCTSGRNDLELVRYLLESTPSLKKMVIKALSKAQLFAISQPVLLFDNRSRSKIYIS